MVMRAMIMALGLAAPVFGMPMAEEPAAVRTVHRQLQQLTAEQLKILMSLLDDDKNGKINIHEMMDVFDGVNDDALGIKDCDGNTYPHHWLGDGFCDQGKSDKNKKGGNFNCNIFLCDNGDCKKDDKCKVVKGRDQMEVAADGKKVFGHVKGKDGEIFEIDLRKGKTYHIWTSAEPDAKHHIQDVDITLYAADAKQILAKGSDSKCGKHNTELVFRPSANINDATIKVTPAHAGHSGSFVIQATSGKAPKCKSLKKEYVKTKCKSSKMQRCKRLCQGVPTQCEKGQCLMNSDGCCDISCKKP